MFSSHVHLDSESGVFHSFNNTRVISPDAIALMKILLLKDLSVSCANKNPWKFIITTQLTLQYFSHMWFFWSSIFFSTMSIVEIPTQEYLTTFYFSMFPWWVDILMYWTEHIMKKLFTQIMGLLEYRPQLSVPWKESLSRRSSPDHTEKWYNPSPNWDIALKCCGNFRTCHRVG